MPRVQKRCVVYERGGCTVFFKTKDAFGGLSNMAGGYPIQVRRTTVRTSEALHQPGDEHGRIYALVEGHPDRIEPAEAEAILRRNPMAVPVSFLDIGKGAWVLRQGDTAGLDGIWAPSPEAVETIRLEVAEEVLDDADYIVAENTGPGDLEGELDPPTNGHCGEYVIWKKDWVVLDDLEQHDLVAPLGIVDITRVSTHESRLVACEAAIRLAGVEERFEVGMLEQAMEWATRYCDRYTKWINGDVYGLDTRVLQVPPEGLRDEPNEMIVLPVREDYTQEMYDLNEDDLLAEIDYLLYSADAGGFTFEIDESGRLIPPKKPNARPLPRTEGSRDSAAAAFHQEQEAEKNLPRAAGGEGTVEAILKADFVSYPKKMVARRPPPGGGRTRDQN